MKGEAGRLTVTWRTDGLEGEEGTFLACSFWLVEAMHLEGRYAEAKALFERLLTLRNDVGLLAEEYDTRLRRQVGNFPQAFTHLALINAVSHVIADEQNEGRGAGDPAGGVVPPARRPTGGAPRSACPNAVRPAPRGRYRPVAVGPPANVLPS